MDTPSPSTASTTAHAVGYNDEPSITAAPLRSTDDLAVDAGQLSSLILTTEATATPQRIVESVTSLTSSGILAEGQRMPTVRDLARLLRTSPATVSSAYHALARSGILRSRGRAGTFVLRQSRTHRYDAGDLLAEAPATAPDRPIIDLSKGTPGPFAAAGHPPVSRQARHAQGIRQFIRRADHPAHAGTDFATQLAV